MKYAYHDYTKSREEALQNFENTLENQNIRHICNEYVTILKSTNLPIGIVDYDVQLQHENGGIIEIGYFIKPEYWGQGFGLEMAKSLIDYVYVNTNVHKVIASCNSSNMKSENIMKKLGMLKEGVFRKSRYKNNRWEDETKYGLLREDWLKDTQHS
jgi:ribosomal-protein-alanine N-acetyltransferase